MSGFHVGDTGGSGKAADDGKLGPPPPAGAPTAVLRRYLEQAFGLPHGYHVERVIRHGGRDGTALTVHVRPPGGKEIVIRYAEERHCRSVDGLRGRIAADTNGICRARLIKGAPTALDIFEVLCEFADSYTAIDDRETTWEWIQELMASCEVETRFGLHREHRYEALRALKRHRYTKALALEPTSTAAPLVLRDTDEPTAHYITARHLAVFVRYQLAVEVATDDFIASRLIEVGGSRHPLQQWADDRSSKLKLVLYRLPEDTE
jgi:hypothetical protein